MPKRLQYGRPDCRSSDRLRMRQKVTFRRLKGYCTALAFLTISGLGGMVQGAGAQMALQTSAVQTYTVRPGDTAYSVARLAGTDVPTLLRLNDLKAADLRPVTLKPGQVLKLPAGPPQPASSAAPRSHTVQPGQTLYNVARLYGFRSAEVQDFNHLSSAELKPGQVLLLPSGTQGVQSSPATVPVPVPVAIPSRLTPSRPAAVNPLPLPGVQLSLAVPPRHTVQPGQTLYAVARLYNLRADDLLALNQLTSSDLRFSLRPPVLCCRAWRTHQAPYRAGRSFRRACRCQLCSLCRSRPTYPPPAHHVPSFRRPILRPPSPIRLQTGAVSL